METEAKLYEIAYLFSLNLKEEEILSFKEKIRDIITKNGGLILSEGKNKKQNLAYPIKKETSAIFSWLKFLLKSDKLELVRELFKNQKEILRFLIVKLEKEEKIKSVVSRPTTLAKQQEIKTPKEEKVKTEEIDKKLEELLNQ